MKELLLCLLCVSLLTQAVHAQTNASAKQTAPTGPVIEMEPYVVRDNRVLPNPEQWHYVKVPRLILTRGQRNIIAPGYEMLTNLNVSQTKVLVSELQLRQFAATYLWPMLTQALPSTPIYVVADLNLQQSAIRPIVTIIDGWSGEPIVATDVQPSPGNFNSFRYTAETVTQSFAAQYGLSEMGDMNSDMGLSDEDEEPASQETTKQRLREDEDSGIVKPLPDGFVELAINGGPLAALVRAGEPKAGVERPSEEQLAATLSYELNLFALKSLPQKLPHWFARGLGNLLGCTQVSQTEIRFALVREKLTGQNMPKLATIFQKEDAFLHEEALLASVFVHYGLYGDNGKYAARFMQFVERIGNGAPPDEMMFKEVFGVGMRRMENELATYARTFAAFKSTDIKGAIPDMPACTMREATQAEVARIKSEIYISQTNPAKALDELRIAYWRGERDPAMLAALASVEEKIGSEARARKIIKTLMSMPTPPPQACIVSAHLQLKDMRAGKPGDAKLNPAESSHLINVLSGALVGGLATEDLCGTLAEIVAQSAGQPDANITDFLQQAAKRYPHNKNITEALQAGGAPAATRPPA